MSSPSAEELREFFSGIHREFEKLRMEIEQGKLSPHCNCSHPHGCSSSPPPNGFPNPSLLPPSTQESSNQSPPSIPPPQPINTTPSHTCSSRQNRPPPRFPQAVISKLKPGPNAWREAITQWEEPNETTRTKPLKDWPLEWYTGAMSRVTGAQYHQRKCIATEYYRCV